MKSPGTTLYFHATGTPPFTLIATVVSFQPANAKWDSSEETHLGSPDALKEFSAGWGDEGEAKIKCKFTAAQFITFKGMAKSRANYFWQMKAPLQTGEVTPFILDWNGPITGIDWDTFERSKSDVIQVEFTTKASGEVVATAPTGP